MAKQSTGPETARILVAARAVSRSAVGVIEGGASAQTNRTLLCVAGKASRTDGVAEAIFVIERAAGPAHSDISRD